jgi:hypothetical protein
MARRSEIPHFLDVRRGTPNCFRDKAWAKGHVACNQQSKPPCFTERFPSSYNERMHVKEVYRRIVRENWVLMSIFILSCYRLSKGEEHDMMRIFEEEHWEEREKDASVYADSEGKGTNGKCR